MVLYKNKGFKMAIDCLVHFFPSWVGGAISEVKIVTRIAKAQTDQSHTLQ
jgi:hypothetical protein